MADFYYIYRNFQFWKNIMNISKEILYDYCCLEGSIYG